MLGGIGRVLLPSAVPGPSGHEGETIGKSSCRRGVVLLVRAEEEETAAQDKRGWSLRVAETRREEAIISARGVSSLFAKPLSTLYPRRPCRYCGGVREIACDICDGRGRFAKGGYHKRNPISVERIVGSKWTAMERTFGWRHFRVHSKRRGSGKDWFVEMSATCDEATRFWVNFQNLKDRERWSMGWLQKAEIIAANNKDPASNLVCKACKGEGRQPCSCTLRDPEETTLDIIEV